MMYFKTIHILTGLKGIALCIPCMYLLVSCEETIQYNFPEADDKLVVNALFTPDNKVSVNVSKTYQAYNKDPLMYNYIENAGIKLFEDNVYCGSLTHQFEGKYVLGFYPKSGKTYKLICTAPGYNDTVMALTSVPGPVKLNVSKIYQTGIDKNRQLAIDISISDPPGPNYYYLACTARPHFFSSELSENTPFTYSINDVLIGKWPSDNPDIKEILVFNDKQFENNQFKTTIYMAPLHTANEEVVLQINLYSVTRDFYDYTKTINNQAHASISNLAGLPAVYSNIVNGYGLFSGYSCSSDTLVFLPNPNINVLNYGNAFFNVKDYGLPGAKHVLYLATDEIELSFGSIKFYVDNLTKQLKSKGLSVSFKMQANGNKLINNGLYDFAKETPFKLIGGAIDVASENPFEGQHEYKIKSGTLNVARLAFDSNYNGYIAEVQFECTDENNQTLKGYYNGLVALITKN